MNEGSGGLKYNVHWVSHSPASYNTQLFRQLAANSFWNFTVHYQYPQSGAHFWKINLAAGYETRYFYRTAGVDWGLLRTALTEKKSLFVFAGWIGITNQLAFTLLALAGKPYAIWNDTPNLKKPRNFLKQNLRAAFLRFVFRHATAVMSTGKPGLANMARMGCPPEKLVSFPCFIDNNIYTTGSRSQRSHEIVFGSSGRLAPEKGYDLALAALAKVYANRLDSFRYRIAGTGPEYEKLLSQAKEAGISDRIEFTGWLDPADISNFYRDTDIFLHPARYEPYGVSVLEAMAAGTAVIGSDATGAVQDRISHLQNGLVHRSGDADDLAIQIESLVLNRPLIARLSEQARATAEEWPLERAVAILQEVVARAFNPAGA